MLVTFAKWNRSWLGRSLNLYNIKQTKASNVNFFGFQDEEKDALLKQFQHLANETNTFDSERENMERSIRSHQQEVTTLQSELSTVRRRLGELEQLYSQQKSAGVQAEIQADDLLRRMSVLERDLRDARGDKVFVAVYN